MDVAGFGWLFVILVVGLTILGPELSRLNYTRFRSGVMQRRK